MLTGNGLSGALVIINGDIVRYHGRKIVRVIALSSDDVDCCESKLEFDIAQDAIAIIIDVRAENRIGLEAKLNQS